MSSDLHTKLREKLSESVIILESNRDVGPRRWEIALNLFLDDAIVQIEQAFADEGYTKSKTYCLHQFVHSFCDRQHEGETCILCNTFRHMSKEDADSHQNTKHVADFSKGKLSNLMAGQEWYDRFEKELGKPKVFVGYGYDDIGYDEDDVINAAKRASGIEPGGGDDQ